MNKLLPVFLALSSLVVSGFAQQQVTDPVADFLRLAVAPDDKLLKLEVDLNHDGKKEIFLSRTNLVLGKSGNAWTVYIPNANGYVRVDETDSGYPIVFPIDRYYIGPLQGAQGDVLATYSPGGGGKGSLSAYQIVGTKVHEITIQEDFEPGGAGKETFKKLFINKPKSVANPVPSVHKLNMPKSAIRLNP